MQTVLLLESTAHPSQNIANLVMKCLSCHCIRARSGHETLDYVLAQRQPQPDLVLLDMSSGGADAIRTVRALRKLHSDLPILVLVPPSGMADAMRAMDARANDFLTLPVAEERLRISVGNALGMRHAPSAALSRYIPPSRRTDFSEFIGENDAFRLALLQAKLAADDNAHVLIEAEAGSGISMLARAIHDNSPRRNQRFIVLDREAQLQPMAMQSLQEQAGTIFLHQALTCSPHATEKLTPLFRLLLLSEAKVVFSLPPSDILPQAMPEQLASLFAFLRLRLPPLRERHGDIPALTGHFLQRAVTTQGTPEKQLSTGLLQGLQRYDWPGNVKELQQVIYLLALHAEREVITEDDFRQLPNAPLLQRVTSTNGEAALQISPLDAEGNLRPLLAIEEEIIRYALGNHKGSRSDIARRLGIGRTTLYRKAQQLVAAEGA